ncbi:MAG: class I SAM-dependent methyltransferase [Deltaproteobacteria bacterium]|nr:MAG: class I SAM-dependent methyltransferase [Deltaproteobacteria bacterium]
MFDRRGPTFFELARQALSSTEKGYDLLAPKFEYTPFRTPDDLLVQVAPHIGPVDDALDVACGTGAGVRMLKPLAKRITGVDMSAGMLEEAERLCAEAPGVAELRFVQGDARDMPFEDAFDVAVTFGANGHILPADEPAFFGSIYKALKPGGRFLLLTHANPGPLHPFWWAARGFNAAMHVRNAVIDPPFVMFYLTMTWPMVREPLEAAGFEVEARHGLFTFPYTGGILVVATKPA